MPFGFLDPSAVGGGAFPSVDISTDLTLIDASQLGTGQPVWDKNLNTYWTLDKDATETLDPMMVVATSDAVGRWMRDLTYNSLQWIQQTVWRVNPTTGSDQNSGLVGAPLATAREWWRRTGGKYQGAPTLLAEINLPATDGLWYPTFNVLQSALSAFVMSGSLVATRTVATLTSNGAAQNPAANTSPTFTDAAVVSWAADVGNFIYTTSGALKAAVILADLGGGVAMTSQWFDPATFGTTTPPVNVSYQVASPTVATLPNNALEPAGGSQITYKRFAPANSIQATAQGFSIFAECKVTNGTGGGLNGRAMGGLQFLCCSFSGTHTTISGGGYTTINFCGFVSTGLGICGRSASILQFNVFRATGLQVGAIQATDDQAASVVLSGDNGWFSTATAISLSKASMGTVRSTGTNTIYGTGQTTVLQLRGGSKFLVKSGYTPTLTGTTEISWPNGNNQIPPLAAGLVVPLAVNCSTWANWAAAPFNGVCYNYGNTNGGDGSSLIRG